MAQRRRPERDQEAPTGPFHARSPDVRLRVISVALVDGIREILPSFPLHLGRLVALKAVRSDPTHGRFVARPDGNGGPARRAGELDRLWRIVRHHSTREQGPSRPPNSTL